MRVRMMVAAAMMLGLLGSIVPARAASDHRVLMSNFRFCNQRPFPCDPLDVGYVPTPGGTAPVTPVYSSITTVVAKPGETVTWVYDEGLCANDVFCPPHTVTFTDATLGQRGDVKKQGETITWLVPAEAKPGTILPYFCKYHVNFGMTGQVQIA